MNNQMESKCMDMLLELLSLLTLSNFTIMKTAVVPFNNAVPSLHSWSSALFPSNISKQLKVKKEIGLLCQFL